MRNEAKDSERRRRNEAHWRDLERPRRYAVKLASSELREVNADTPQQATAGRSNSVARLMGTHETLSHAAARLGWRDCGADPTNETEGDFPPFGTGEGKP